jgi:hypothetical protein
VNPHILTPEEFARRADERDHFITAVLGAPRLFVVGGEDELRRLGQFVAGTTMETPAPVSSACGKEDHAHLPVL